MNEPNQKLRIVISAAEVTFHLQTIQSIIQRMAANSASCKAWCITIVSAILVLVADKSKSDYAQIAFIPILLFFVLDAYYLALEKGFRKSYDEFVETLHSGDLLPHDLFQVKPSGISSEHQKAAFKSFSVWGFYSLLAISIFIAKTQFM